ncbi:MAG: 2-hydroxyacyl-CoA dehydratase [Bacilli bacterium]|nr:2-hydroxyacyl-CoA dehydratase [Bacilli bacterium]
MYNIAFPQMGDYCVPAYFLLSNILDANIIKAPKITNKTIELGFKYSPDFVCTPFKYTLGTMIECLDMGADTLIQYGGGCRYGYYAELQEKILNDLGYDFKMINLVIEGRINLRRINKLLKQIDSKYSKIKSIYYSFITLKMIKYMDEIDDFIRENVGFEVVKGSFEKLKEEMLIKFGNVKSYHELKIIYRYFLNKFKCVKVYKPDDRLRIGIIGELYTLMEPFSNYYIEKELAKNNIEVKRFTNVDYLFLRKSKRMKKYLKNNPYVKYSMGADASDNVANCQYLCENGYDGIIHIKSSFCTPEIGVMQVISKIAESYDVPIMFFSFDGQSSETGFKTRLEAFYDMLEMRKNK